MNIKLQTSTSSLEFNCQLQTCTHMSTGNAIFKFNFKLQLKTLTPNFSFKLEIKISILTSNPAKWNFYFKVKFEFQTSKSNFHLGMPYIKKIAHMRSRWGTRSSEKSGLTNRKSYLLRWVPHLKNIVPKFSEPLPPKAIGDISNWDVLSCLD